MIYKISASILDSDFTQLGKEINRLKEAKVDMLHIDVMDGIFVPNITVGQPVIKKIREFTDLFLDVHLMIKNPEAHIDSFAESGADLIDVSVEECIHLDWTLRHIKSKGLKAAAALNPSTPLSSIENVFPLLDMILIMTVNPGFGGQRLIKEMLYKIRRLKTMLDVYKDYSGDLREIDIEVDGGINPETAQQVIEAGANVLVLGSAIYRSDDPLKVINEVKNKFKFIV
jgi:ribulose-phosphate 3-epimerase